MKAFPLKISSIIILAFVVCYAILIEGCTMYHNIPGATYYPAMNCDTVNRYDSNKLRNGYWAVCFTKTLGYTDNKLQAVYYGYIYYQHGSPAISSMGGLNPFPFDSMRPTENCSQPKKDTVVLINGKFEGRMKNGILLNENFYKNGIIVWTKTYNEKGQHVDSVDYSHYPLFAACSHYSKEIKEYEEDVYDGKLIYKRFYSNGNLESEFCRECGYQKLYYENGKLKKEIYYKNNKKISVKNYDENGNQIKK